MFTRLFTFSLLTVLACAGLAGRTPPPVSPAPIQAKRLVAPPEFVQGVPLSPYTLRVPFRLAGRLIVVQAKVEDQTGNFIIDTGSSDLILNTRHFQGGIQKSGTVSVGATGDVREVRSRRIQRFHWDSLTFKRVNADLIDLNHIERKKNIRLLGLIGYQLLRDFELLIDFQLRQIILTRTDRRGERLDPLAIAEEPVDSLNFELRRHVVVVNGKVNGHRVAFGLDSGAELNLLDREVKRRVLDQFKISRRVVLNGMNGAEETEVLAGKLYRFRAKNQRCSGMKTLLTNMDDLNRAFQTKLDGLLGYEFLCVRRTIINYKKEKLYFLQWHRP